MAGGGERGLSAHRPKKGYQLRLKGYLMDEAIDPAISDSEGAKLLEEHFTKLIAKRSVQSREGLGMGYQC